MNLSRKIFYEFHQFRIDPEKRLLLDKEKVVSLSPKAFDTLLLLIQNSTRIVTKDEFLKKVWHDLLTTGNSLHVQISKIRKALGQSRYGHQCIEAIEKQGYRFACEVRAVQDGELTPLLEQERVIQESVKLVRTIEGQEGFVFRMAFDPTGQTIVSGYDDGTLKLWDVSSGRLLRTLEGHRGAVISVAFDPTGRCWPAAAATTP